MSDPIPMCLAIPLHLVPLVCVFGPIPIFGPILMSQIPFLFFYTSFLYVGSHSYIGFHCHVMCPIFTSDVTFFVFGPIPTSHINRTHNLEMGPITWLGSPALEWNLTHWIGTITHEWIPSMGIGSNQ